MGINFPLLPTIGTLHPNPAVAGQPQYAWDGVAWKSVVNNADMYVKKSGDTMTGDLQITKSTPTLTLNKTATSGQDAVIHGRVNGLMRWGIDLGAGAAETGGNVGSDFFVVRCDDAGNYIDAPIAINRKSGQVLLNNVPAAPFDALAYNGMQINGSMDISQEKGDAGSTSGYICDGHIVAAGGPTLTGFRSLGGTPIGGLPNCVVLNASTPKPVLAAIDAASLQVRVEGLRAARLGFGVANASPVTIAFYSAHVRPGVYCVSLRNFNGSRSCIASYTQNAANTWEYKVLTFPPCLDGSWPRDNTMGLLIDFSMAVGTNFHAPLEGVWYPNSYLSTAAQINGAAAATDWMRITGILILPGIYAPTAAQAPLIMRPYDQELMTCQRYFESWGDNSNAGFNIATTGAASDATSSVQLFTFKVKKRATPTFTYSALNDFRVLHNGFVSGATLASLSLYTSNTDTVSLLPVVTSAVQVPKEPVALACFNNQTTARLFFNARL